MSQQEITKMDIRSHLISDDKASSSDARYLDHILDIYKLYVDMADKISARRQAANSFFLTINTGIVAFVGYLQTGEKQNNRGAFYGLIALAGIALCYSWYRLIRSYKGLNSGKFKVIHEIEKILPLAPYDAEWEAVGRGNNPKLYLSFAQIEMVVPWIFLVLHLIVLILSVF